MIHWISKLFINSIHILFLRYLLLLSCFSTPKLAGFHKNYYGINQGYLSTVLPNIGDENCNWLPQRCLLGGPKVGASATSTLHSRGSPTKGNKIRVGCLNHAFSRAPKWAQAVRHPCILGGPQQRGAKSELAASAMPPRGLKSGRKCYVTPAFSGVPNKGEQYQKWLPQGCLLGGPKVGASATSPLHSQGSPAKGNKIRIGCLSHAF